MNLHDYAKENKISYSTSWRKYRNGEIPNAKKVNGEIIIPDDNGPSMVTKFLEAAPLDVDIGFKRTSLGSDSLRKNRSAVITPNNQYANIDKQILPYTLLPNGTIDKNTYSIQNVTILCQKAYFGFSAIRNVIDILVDFSTNKIDLKGGNAKVNKFFEAYFEKIGLDQFQEMFYRELYRGSNVFIYKLFGKIKPEDVVKLNQSYGSEAKASKSVNIPVKYIILNPADIQAGGNLTFQNVTYYKVLSDYELARLRNPQTPEDIEIVNGLDELTKTQIKSKATGPILMPLDNKKITAIFGKKQDYEPFSIPFLWPVLRDIEIKEELKLMDLAIARTCQQSVLLVTTGYQDADGNPVVNPKHLESLRAIFANETVSRVLIHDFSTKVAFVLPEVGQILDPKKYEIVNEDIRNGLGDILSGGNNEKFANEALKSQIFFERLKNNQRKFLNEFLIPEIKRIAKELNFKNYPTPVYREFNLKDELQWAKLYTELAKAGVLTAQETIKAVETGNLPSEEESIANQTAFKSHKDNGLYEPIITKNPDNLGANGRPVGSKAPQSTKTVSPIGTKAEQQFSLKKVTENFGKLGLLEAAIEKYLKTKHKIKQLSEAQMHLVEEFSSVIIRNKQPDQWIESIDKYINSPLDDNKEMIQEIEVIAATHGIDHKLAALLHASKK